MWGMEFRAIGRTPGADSATISFSAKGEGVQAAGAPCPASKSTEYLVPSTGAFRHWYSVLVSVLATGFLPLLVRTHRPSARRLILKSWRLPAQREAEARHGGVAGEVHRRIILIARW